MVEFVREGGRGGYFSGKFGERHACMEWEMLVGEMDFILYSDNAYWLGEEKAKLTEPEKIIFITEFANWANNKNIKYEVY